MNTTKLLLTICMLAPGSLACAEVKEHPVEAAAPVLAASADPSVVPAHVDRLAVDAKPASAGVAEALPDLPLPPAFSVGNVVASRFHVQRAKDKSVVLGNSLPNSPGVSLLQSSPLAGAARRMGAQHFNSQDGSSVDAFAICYRLSSRSSLQVIPGDPAPVKIPVTTMANNMGVTVGMVLRLSKTR